MRLSEYLKRNVLNVLLFIFIFFVINSILIAFKTSSQAILGVDISLLVGVVFFISYDYGRRKKFYDIFLKNLEHLDKKYLIIEMMDCPNFYDGKILYDSLYEINKSMNEKVKEYTMNLNDFKEYIEMWIHEVKLPLSSINLMAHNHKEISNKKVIEQLKRLDDDVEQVLYYVRSENAEKDYLIKEVNLNKVVSNVALRNKDILLENKIDLMVDLKNIKILTDSKWLEFIINQIISNSIKYIRKNTAPYIKISIEETKDNTILKIYDSGIGISKKDIPKVFDKTFTGSNGRMVRTSTGMGLYIAKNLCNKLGHQITIDSIENEYTEVKIIFVKNNFFEVVK